MATVKNNLATKGLTVEIGNLVFCKRGDKTTVYVQSPRSKPLTWEQPLNDRLHASYIPNISVSF